MKFLRKIRFAFTGLLLLLSNLLIAQTCPVINSVTNSSAVCVGTSFVMQVNASSPDLSTLTYSWFKNGVAITGASTNQYTISSFSAGDAASYTVKVGNACGTLTTSNPIQLTLSGLPVITSVFTSPVNICVGENYSTQVIANTNAGGTLSYQWKRAGSLIPGATNATLNLTALQTTDAGVYTVEVINGCGPTTSSNLQINVSPKPIITLQPVGSTVCVGGAITLSADVAGATSFKWQKDGVDVGNITKTFTLSTSAKTDAGSYTFIASNGCGNTISAAAVMVVNAKPTMSSITSPANVCAGNTAILVASVNGNGDNNLTYSWSLKGIAIPNGNASTLSVPNFQSSNVGVYALAVTNGCGTTTSTSLSLDKDVQLIQAPSIAAVADQNVCLNATLNVSPTLTNLGGVPATYQWYFEGGILPDQQSSQLRISNIQSNRSGRYFLSVNNGCSPVSGAPFNVNVLELPVIKTQPAAVSDLCVGSVFSIEVLSTGAQLLQWFKNDVAIAGATGSSYSISSLSVSDAARYNVKLSNNCGYSITSSNAVLTVGSSPTVVTPPANISSCLGQPASANIVANTNGGGPLKYEWSASTGVIIAGATSSTLSFANVSKTDAKTYTVSVENKCGKINGGSFALTLADKPTVIISTSIPNNTTTGNPAVCQGSPINFTVTENSNGAALSYTWYKDDISKGVQSSNALTIASSTSTDAGVYKLAVSNACGVAISNVITFNVHDKPLIVTQPESATLCEGTTLNLSGLAQNKTGTSSPIQYSWTFNGNAVTATSANLTLSNIANENHGSYRLQARNECGSVSSNIAAVTVVSKPKYTILTPSSELSICSAISQTRTLALNVYADNAVQPNIAWTTDVGSITSSNNLPSIGIASVGKNATYFATMTNACGSTQLNNGQGIIVYNELALPSVSKYSMPPLTTFCERSPMKLNVATNSNGYETYVWKLNTKVVQTNQSGNPSSSDFQKIVTSADGGTYTVDITNSCGTVANAVSIPVTINPTPNIDFNVSSQTNQCLAGNIFTFNNTSTNTTGGIRYTWDFGDGVKDITSILTASHTYTVSGNQTVKLTGINDFGCTSSNTRNVVIAADPRISAQPVGKVVCEGDGYLLSATINSGGATSLSYQWYFNGQPISNNNSNTYSIVSMSASNVGSYYLKVMNSGCNLSTQSEPVNISYQERPDVSFNVGGKSLTSCITAAEYTFTNTTPAVAGVSYLWNFSDGKFYTSPNVVHTFVNTGIYNVTLTASAGGCSATGYLLGNQASRIKIDGVPVINKDLPSVVTYKKGDPIVLNINAGAIDANGTEMPVNYYWYKLPSTTVVGTNSPTFNSITSALVSDSGRYYVTVNNVCGSTRSNTTLVKVNDVPSITLQPIATSVCLGKSLQLKVGGISNDNSTPLYQWYYRKDLNATPLPIPSGTGPILNIAAFSNNDVGNYFVKLSNEIGAVESNSILVIAESMPTVNAINSIPSLESGICVNTGLQLNASVSTLTNSSYTISWEQNGVALTGQEALQINFASIKKSNAGEIAIKVTNTCGTSTGKVNLNVIDIPQFIQSPSAVNACINGSATFIAKLQSINSGSPFGYQWLKNGVGYTGTGIVTNEQLSLSNIQITDAAFYSLQSTNTCGLNTSSAGKLTVVATAPTISQQPSAVNTCAGGQNTVTLVASSDDNQLLYSWYKNGNLLSKEVASQLSFNTIAASDAGTYRAIVTNGCNLSTTSNTFQIVVKEKVSLNAKIVDKKICVGNNLGADISSYLIGADINTTYQWMLNGINLSDATAKTNNLTLLNVNKTNEGSYSVLASNSCGASSLDLFKLSTTAVPEITTQPITGFACAGGSFTNTVVVANAAQLPLSYQWYKDGNIVASNGLSQQLLLQNIALADQGLYAVRVSNSCGTTQSSSARLSLTGNPLITQQPAAISSCSGLENKAIVVASSDDNRLAYSWYKDGALITGQINPQLIFSKIGSGDGGTYRVIVTNGCNLSTTSSNFQVVVKEKIALTGSIADKVLCVGTNLNADISGSLSGVDLASVYQWKLNGIDIADASAKTNFLKLLNLSKTNEGSYSVLASNSCGASSLDLFKLSTTSVPEITTQPIAGFACAGGSFTNTVVVANAAQLPLSYQWLKDGNIVASNGLSQQLLLQNIAVADQGLYAVRVSNSCGTTQSSSARLSLTGNPVISQQPAAISSCSGLENKAIVVASSDDNRLAYSWYKDGALITGQINPQLIFSKIGSGDGGTYRVIVTNGCNLSTTSSNFQVVVKEKIALTGSIADKVLCVGTNLNADISGSLSGVDLASVYQWKLNGIDIADASAKTNFLKLLNLSKTNEGSYSIIASNSCGASSLDLFKLSTTSVPEITTQPIAGFACAGGSFTNTVVVANAAQLPLSYQWLKDGNIVASNGLSQQLLLQNIAVADQGLYAVRVSNSCGTTQSSSARLSLTGNPVISQQPAAISSCSGLENKAIVVASSDDNRLAYSWYKDGALITGQINPQLIFSKIGSGDGGTYRVIVTNGCNLSTTSSNFQVVVKEKIALTGSIADKVLCVGANLNADISGSLSGVDLASVYQWKLNGIDIADASAKTNFLKLLNLSKTNEGSYSVLASNSCGASSLDLFKLSTTAVPEITTQPIAGFACAGGSFTNTVVVANAAQLPLSYQWLKDGNIVASNGLSQQLLLQNIAVADQGLYAVRVSNSCGTTQSSSARLSLTGNPVIAQQPQPITACVGEEGVATIEATSDDGQIQYSWFKDGILMPGQIGPRLVFNKIASNDVGVYRAAVTNGCKVTTTTSNFQIIIKEKISQLSTIADKQLCAGTDLLVDISKNLKGADLTSSYQWKLNGINIVDASAVTNTIKLLAVSKSNVGNYAVLASNSCGSSLLDLFKLGVTNLPSIETQPLAGEVCENLDWSNKVVVSNTDQIGFTYQWFKDGLPLLGANNPEIYLSNVNASNQGLYSVRLSSACGNVMSNKELFQVRAKPEVSISLLGTAPNQCLETNAFVFRPNVLINDNSSVDLTWDFGDGVFSKQNQVSHSYQFSNDFNVYLFAKSAYGCLDTAKQLVSVNTKPIVVENIFSQIICAGGQLNYNVDVKVKPNETVGYQWFFNQDPIANAVKNSFSLNNVQKVNNGLYKLKITNACGITYSTEAELKVAEKPLVAVPLPVNQKVCEGESFTLKPTVFSLLPNTYQWYKNGLPYVGQELDSLLLKRFTNNDVANFSVMISNSCGTTASKDGNLIMKNFPRSTQALLSDTICYQSGTALKITNFTNNDDSLFFNWYKDGALIAGATTTQYPILKFNAPDAGAYSIALSNSCGVLNVPVARLTLNQIFAQYRLDTADACKGTLKVSMLDTTRSMFAVVSNYWQIQEERKILPNFNSANYQFTNSGTYTIRHAVMDAKGCISDTISKTVINYGKPTAAFSINDTCLSMPSVALNNSVYGHGSSKLVRYTWNFGDTVIVRNTPTVPGYAYKTPGPKTLSLVVQSDSSCVTDTLSKNLMVYGKPNASFTSQDSCQGFPVLFTNRSSTSYLPDSVVNFSWNFDDGTVVATRNPQHVFKQYGAYKVKLTAYSSSCPFLFTDTTMNLTIKSPRANLEYPRIQTVKKVVGQLNANGGGRSYSWFPFTGLTDSKIRNPRFNLNDDKVNYTITIVDSAGCVYKDKQEVWAFNKPDIYLSTGFSPNKDGINDRYAPEYVEIKILEYFRVADKHNRQVFISNSLSDKWDGSYKGSLLPPDPYLVTVSGIDIFGNKIVRQGIVVLVK